MTLASDLRYSVRSFRRSPSLASTLILTIALGVGGNAVIFGFVGGLITSEAATSNGDGAASFARVSVLLLYASALVLFLACSTIAGLLLSRARVRSHEMAVRVALGGTRSRLARLCVTDSLVLTISGGLVGVVLATWTASLLPLLLFVEDADTLRTAPDARWFITGALAWIAVLLVCSAAPILIAPNRNPSFVLRAETTGVSGRATRPRLRMATAQVSVCCLLVVLASLIRSDLGKTLRTAEGQAAGSLLIMPVEGDASSIRGLEDAVRAATGVTEAAVVRTVPGGRHPSRPYRIERPQPRTRELRMDASTLDASAWSPESLKPLAGRPFSIDDGASTCLVALVNEKAAEYFAGDAVGRRVESSDGLRATIIGVLASTGGEDERPALYYYEHQVRVSGVSRNATFYTDPIVEREGPVDLDVNVTSPGYFETFADPAVAGRVFDEGDGPRGCNVAVLADDTARHLFDGHAVGGALIDAFGSRLDIIGVVRAAPLAIAQRTGRPLVILPLAQSDEDHMTVAARTSVIVGHVGDEVARSIESVPGVRTTAPVSTLEAHLVRTSLADERVSTMVMTVMAAIAVVVSIVGVHGVMADVVVHRRRELALRIALGARASRLIGQIVFEGARVAIVGSGLGLLVALCATPLLGRILGQPHLPDALSLAVACAAVLLVVSLSCALPAWHAVSVDPREAMQ